MTRRRCEAAFFVVGFVAFVAVLATSGPVSAADASQQVDKEQPEQAQPASASNVTAVPGKPDSPGTVRVFTNKDLERMFGDESQETSESSADTPSAETAQAAPEPRKSTQPTVDPLAQMKQEQAARAQRQQLVAQAEADLEAARAKLENLEVQLLASRNPFSARPQLSDEEKELRATSGETAAERNKRTQLLVDQAREEVAAAEKTLAEAKAGGR
jgi:hypothetical protein